MKRIRQFFKTTIVGGVVVILPLAILFFFARFMYVSIVRNVRPFVLWLGLDVSEQEWVIDVISFFLLLTFCFLLGLLVRTQFGSRTFSYVERNYLEKLPFYSIIKETVQQFSGKSKYKKLHVVLADAFGNGGLVTGFVTDITEDKEVATIFVPTGPNPTNGLIFHLPNDKITYIDVKPEEAMKAIIGVGAGSSAFIELSRKMANIGFEEE